jgi:putative membrane protein
MEFLFKILLSITANISALLLAGYFDKDFLIMSDVEHIVPLAAFLALLNLTVRPILKLLFSPLIGITLGAFNVVISAAILYAVDIYSNSLTINGLWALVIGAHLVGLVITLIDYSSAVIYGSGEL